MADNLTQEGGDRYAAAAPIIAAIEAALGVAPDDEIREAFGMGDWRVVTPEHRARYGQYFAPRVYQAMCETLRRAVIGDYRARLTAEERALIDAGMAEYQPAVPWDGELPQYLLDEIAEEVAYLIEEGATQAEIDAERDRMIEDWRLDNGADGYSPDELAEIRAGLVDRLRGDKKPAFEELGGLNWDGFVSIQPRKSARLWPIAAIKDAYLSSGGGSVPEGSLRYLNVSLLGVRGGYGEVPTVLPVGHDMGTRFAVLVEGPGFDSPGGSGDELSVEREMIAAVRHEWMIDVALDFEGDGPSGAVEVNTFPGFVLAHVKETLVKADVELFGHLMVMVRREVVKYLMGGAQGNDVVSLMQSWGRAPVSTFADKYNPLQEHLGDWYVDFVLRNGDMEVPPEGGHKVSPWVFDYKRLGADSAASVESVYAAFPRRQRVALFKKEPQATIENIGRRCYGLEWVDRGYWSDEALVYSYQYTPDHYGEPVTAWIMPPLRKRPERVRMVATFARGFVEAINEGEGE